MSLNSFFDSIDTDAQFDVWRDSIKQKLMLLPDDVKVYSGHGSMTTIGFERSHNPFLKE